MDKSNFWHDFIMEYIKITQFNIHYTLRKVIYFKFVF